MRSGDVNLWQLGSWNSKYQTGDQRQGRRGGGGARGATCPGPHLRNSIKLSKTLSKSGRM